ncbi:cadherin-89D isoform X2 [Aphidius gifuensis]|uniref:cadherin-89D isoform X2 n=1 Tax=Aphidius gifuensis TaxID=684658 RepID=UPI001CDCD141|nr:cadherin-89D isoform X2 [Aphidius gifuensis]
MKFTRRKGEFFFSNKIFKYFIAGIFVLTWINCATGCQFYPVGEYLKFIRVPENLAVGAEVLSLEVHPRTQLTIIPIDQEEDAKYFSYKDVNETHISVILSQSLDNLIDSGYSRNILKFRFLCDYSDTANSLISSHLSMTVYVEDVNDHTPQFIGAPYNVAVDELTPPGTIIFRGINAFDGDKINTPNSDVHYAIVRGNEDDKFSLESGHRTALILRKSLDYDNGDRKYQLVITATDRGTPVRSANTTIIINVMDNDDLAPKFTQDTYRAKIYETYPFPRSSIHTEIHFDNPISAKDQDTSINTPIKYTIMTGNERGLFKINSQNGSLYLQRPIDIDNEKIPNNTFHLQIHAMQIDSPLKYDNARVEIEILDLNDNLPVFEVENYNISIVENLPNGFSVLQVVATDNDQGDNAEFIYQLNDTSGGFLIDEKSGWLTVKDERVLDREKISFLKMFVYAVEKKKSVVQKINGKSSVEVEVTLLDANDNNPIFLPTNIYEFTTKSHVKIGTVIGQVHAVDNDLGKNGVVRYGLQKTSGNSSYVNIPFSVNSRTGIISVSDTPLTEGRHAIFVDATDQPVNPSERRFSLAVVTIDVFPPGEDKMSMPDFVGSPYEFWVGANVPIGTSVGQIRINEAVKKKNHIVYDLLHSYREGVPFAVEEQTGTITVIDKIENYVKKLFDFEAVVTNERDLMLVTNVSIHVVNPNENRDLFIKGTTKAPLVFHTKENSQDAFIGQVLPRNVTNATKNIRFLIANQRDVPDIKITEDGELYTVGGLDREMRENYSITVIAETTRGLRVFQVTVVVDDVNDNPPVFDSLMYVGRIKENSRIGTEVILDKKITTHDIDSSINRNYSLILEGDDNKQFTIDQKTARVYFNGMENNLLDREEKSTYELQIVATDNINPKSLAKLTIEIEEENDNAPVFTKMIVTPNYDIKVSEEINHDDKFNYHNSPILNVPENSTIGTMIVRLLANDKDEIDNGKITYAIVNETIMTIDRKTNIKSHFIIDKKTGELFVSRVLPPGLKFNLKIIAKDSANQTDSITIKIIIIDINDHSPVFKKSWYEFNIPEGIYTSYELGEITATDMDMNENAIINYQINSTINNDLLNLIFDIDSTTGIITVTGKLDREICDRYNIIIIAYDNGKPRMSSSGNVAINVLDTNDNPPVFYGYTDIIYTHNNDKYINNNNVELPIYYASINENTKIGTIVTRVYANDSDFIGNGNGLILYDLSYLIGEKQFFTINSKDGDITTITKLNYEDKNFHNLTIIARDLGSPSLTSTAFVYVEIVDVDEPLDYDDKLSNNKPVFQHQYYEVEIEENSIVPLTLLKLNISMLHNNNQSQNYKFSIIFNDNDTELNDYFKIDSNNGTLILIKEVDREYRNNYEFKVKIDWQKSGRGIPVVIYPITDNRISDLDINEAKIIIRVKDINDNAPRFRTKGRPLLAAIGTSINYGHEIIKIEAEDPDEGINGEIRYQILGHDDALRFAIDPLTGQVRSVSTFYQDAGRVFGFDVKATDLCGSENGRSSIVNVFVYVVDDNKQVVMVLGQKPIEIEYQIGEITRALQNVTGLDVRVRKLEPHIEKNLIDTTSTDVYLYAVDPVLNVMVEMDNLNSVFRKKKSEIKGELEKYRLLDITGNSMRRQHYLMSTLEMGAILLGCVIFLGALIIASCIACIRRGKRHCRDPPLGAAMFPAGGPVGFALTEQSTSLGKPSLFPAFVDGLRYYPEPFPNDERRLSICEHEPGCVQHNPCRSRSCGMTKKIPQISSVNSAGCHKSSVASLHSSGQDSGIVARPCHCGHSSSPSSTDSSNSYEDSLKSLHRNSLSNEQSSRGHDTTVIGDSGAVGEHQTVNKNKRQRLHHTLSNADVIYDRDTSLHREMRYRNNNEKLCNGNFHHDNNNNNKNNNHHHHQKHHISRTMIREHPTGGNDSVNVVRLHGRAGSSHSLYW